MKENLLEKNDVINENKYTIYMHKNKINGKVYIGQTRTSVNNRWRDGKGYKGCTLFERAINKYGWDNFDHIVVASNLTQEESCQMEKDLITLYESTNPERGYNLSTGGESGHTGVPMSQEARQKISEAQKGKFVSQETRKKMSLALKGKAPSALSLQKAAEVHNVEVVQLTIDGEYVSCYSSYAAASKQTGINESSISACCNNRDHSKSAGGFLWIKKTDYNLKDKNELYYQNEHLRPVIQLTKSGKYVAEFNSCKEAQNAMNKSSSNSINSCCRGDTMSAYGFIWVYKDEYNENKDYTYKRKPYANQYAVIQLDVNGNFIAEFNSVQDAHKTTGINYCCICDCCKGIQQTAGGFVWKKKIDDATILIKGGETDE